MKSSVTPNKHAKPGTPEQKNQDKNGSETIVPK